MSTENQLKKIIYRAVHRGCKETDFLLGDFLLPIKKVSQSLDWTYARNF